MRRKIYRCYPAVLLILLIRTKKKRDREEFQDKVNLVIKPFRLLVMFSERFSNLRFVTKNIAVPLWLLIISVETNLERKLFISVVVVFSNDGFCSWRADCLQNRWCLVKHIHLRCRRGKEVSGTGFEFRCRSFSKHNFRYSLTHFSFFIAKKNRVFWRNK